MSIGLGSQRQVHSAGVAHPGISSWLRTPMLKGLREGWGLKRLFLLECVVGSLYLVWTYVHRSAPSFSLRTRLDKALFAFLVIFVYGVLHDIFVALKARSTSE